MGEGQLKAAKEGEGEEGRKITLGEDEGKGGEPTKLDAEMRKELKAHLGDSIEIPASVRMENPSDYETHGKVIEMTVEDLYNSPRSIEHMGYDDLGKWTAEQIKSDSILAQDGKAYYSPYKTKDRISTPRHRGDEWAEKQINKLRTEGKAKTGVLVNKLLIHLKTLKPTWFRNQERGQLDDRVLAKVGLGSKRLFRKRIPQEQIDTAMTLLMDLSGSMTGSKSTLAIQTALIYSEVLESLDVPHEILGFTTDSWNSDHVGGFNRTIPLHHIIFKTFDEKMGVVRNRLASALTTSMRHNVDGEAVQWAGARISERKERRKIIMVLSDGYPEDGNWNSRLKAHLKKAVKEVESKGIGCIGVGMMSDAVEDFYRDSVVCDSLNAVPGAVLDKLKQVLLRLA
jgi:cobalamin biosynthesis protein CobT